jgi:hypothetical protein
VIHGENVVCHEASPDGRTSHPISMNTKDAG